MCPTSDETSEDHVLAAHTGILPSTELPSCAVQVIRIDFADEGGGTCAGYPDVECEGDNCVSLVLGERGVYALGETLAVLEDILYEDRLTPLYGIDLTELNVSSGVAVAGGRDTNGVQVRLEYEALVGL